MSVTEELGRESMRQHIVAFRHVNRGWPARFNNELEYARQRYDAGTHEMCQGRDGNVIIQYLVQRKRPTGKRKWFARENGTPISWFDVIAEDPKRTEEEPVV